MKKILFITGIVIAALVLVVALIARPCGQTRIALVNAWASTVNIEIQTNNQEGPFMLWSGRVESSGPPVYIRAPLPGDVSFDVRIKDIATGTEFREEFGYDSAPSTATHMFFIGHEGRIGYHSWRPKAAWKTLLILATDELSCLGSGYSLTGL